MHPDDAILIIQAIKWRAANPGEDDGPIEDLENLIAWLQEVERAETEKAFRGYELRIE